MAVKKRGRPRKIKLSEYRVKLQQLFFSKDRACTSEVISILTRINSSYDLDKAECDSSKIGNLLKRVFCSSEYKVWHENGELLKLVQEVALKIINSK